MKYGWHVVAQKETGFNLGGYFIHDKSMYHKAETYLQIFLFTFSITIGKFHRWDN